MPARKQKAKTSASGAKRRPTRPAKTATKARAHPAGAARKKAAPRRARHDRQAWDALEREVRRLRAARARLERRLIAAVQEIGSLRQFEQRTQMLEAELARRDQEIAQRRREGEGHGGEVEERLGGTSNVSAPS